MARPWRKGSLSKVKPELIELLEEAATQIEWLHNSSGQTLFQLACGDLRIDASLSYPFPIERSAFDLGQLSGQELTASLSPLFPEGTGQARELANQIQLRRAFADPEAASSEIADAVISVVEDFPSTLEDLRVGSNPGDVLDPFIVSANFELLADNDLTTTIETTVSHKALMKIEDLIGRLHERTLSLMRGNVLIPEPRGHRGSRSKEQLDHMVNPFPGADMAQVPSAGDPDGPVRLFQIKNKTGSAKGGDGARLGRQLKTLNGHYGADTFYVAVVGNTLRGHRSKAAVLRESPKTAVLVGRAALREMTLSNVGGELLLRVYQRAFRTASARTGYDLAAVSLSIAASAISAADDAGNDYLSVWLHEAIDGPDKDQDSRLS